MASPFGLAIRMRATWPLRVHKALTPRARPSRVNCSPFRLPPRDPASSLPRSVNANPEAFVAHLNGIRGRIAAAAVRAGRDPAAITLVGVVKTVPIERLRLAIDAGLKDMGQNRVQEAEAACSALGRRGVRWHMIGHLQGNKVARSIDLFDRIHSVDSIELAEALSGRAAKRGMRIPVLIQVNVSGEASKHGVSPAELAAVVERAASLPGLAVDGL